ncbi:MAG: three-Cys-motif partner protein TcmP [bacterium]
MSKYDEIGYWSEVKLDIISKYASAYSTIMNKRKEIRGYIYIDAFAGAGVHIRKEKREFVTGSPLNALVISPAFSEYHFIDLDGDKVDKLRLVVGDRGDVSFHKGDCNRILLVDVFPKCRYEDYRRALCLLDPYGLNVNWEVLQRAGELKSIETFYNFMIMDANMNVFWRSPDKVQASQVARMDAVWGDHSWREAVYKKTPGLFGEIEEKATNKAVIDAFRDRLKKVAGFEYVPDPMPMRNSKGSVIYCLFFASPNRTGAKIVKNIFDNYRNKGVTSWQ